MGVTRLNYKLEWKKLLTETQRDSLISAIKTYGTFTPYPSMDITTSIQHVRGGENVVIKPPMIVYTFMPVDSIVFKSTNLVIANADSKWPTKGFAQRELLQIVAYTKTTFDGATAYHGKNISNYLTQRVMEVGGYYWPAMLTSYGASVRWAETRRWDETGMLQGDKVYKDCMNLFIITTTSWRYVPEGETEDLPITEIDISESDGTDRPAQLTIKV